MTNKDLSFLRQEYAAFSLDEASAPGDPIHLFHQWLDQAIGAGLSEPNAMTLATVTPDSKAAARVVLLKEVERGGFVFYTNYLSAKGRQLAANPHASLVFLWLELHRQVRVSGKTVKVDAAASDQYFSLRPANSRLGAAASPQSQPVGSRRELEERFEELRSRFPRGDLPRPPNWGGYRLLPAEIEFWQGRESRLHDRLLYTREGESWQISRLAP